MLPNQFNYTTNSIKSQQLNKISQKMQSADKIRNIIAEAMKEIEYISPNAINNILNCGNIISMNESGKIIAANFCKNKLCPVCAWRKSLKRYSDNIQMFNFINDNFNKSYIFLTLTIQNVHDLKEGIDKINNAFKRMSNTKRFKNISLGYYRNIEITYNETTKKWHPHSHIIICVNKSYFKSDKYIKAKEWLKMWQEATRDKNISQVKVSAVKNKNGEIDVLSAVLEISKYMSKILEISKYDHVEAVKIAKELIETTYHKRMITTSGIIRDVLHNLGIEPENENIIDNEFDKSKVTTYIWKNGRYKEYENKKQTI